MSNWDDYRVRLKTDRLDTLLTLLRILMQELQVRGITPEAAIVSMNQSEDDITTLMPAGRAQ